MSGNKARHILIAARSRVLAVFHRSVLTVRFADQQQSLYLVFFACGLYRSLAASVLCRTGGTSGGILPDPIPNSAVKAPSAYGTAT